MVLRVLTFVIESKNGLDFSIRTRGSNGIDGALTHISMVRPVDHAKLLIKIKSVRKSRTDRK